MPTSEDGGACLAVSCEYGSAFGIGNSLCTISGKNVSILDGLIGVVAMRNKFSRAMSALRCSSSLIL
jgi:hypothetical protein